ncbi:hypothetical protein [Reyranella soli]|jgi:hypothetical protein|nr:hypothetical protein [Reyranella soli]
MSREVRGMLLGVCIVILAVAAYVLKERPENTPVTITTPKERS